jgi:hypothetical protein
MIPIFTPYICSIYIFFNITLTIIII